MYLRFTTQFINEDGQTKTGLFQALGFIRNHRLTDDEDERKLKILNDWFKNNLDVPELLSKLNTHISLRQHEFKILSWFKDSAKEHILKVHELIEILEKYDLIVEGVTSKNPGIIVYQDEFQVCAHPLKWDSKRVV